jgi:hypothetical protein
VWSWGTACCTRSGGSGGEAISSAHLYGVPPVGCGSLPSCVGRPWDPLRALAAHATAIRPPQIVTFPTCQTHSASVLLRSATGHDYAADSLSTLYVCCIGICSACRSPPGTTTTRSQVVISSIFADRRFNLLAMLGQRCLARQARCAHRPRQCSTSSR